MSYSRLLAVVLGIWIVVLLVVAVIGNFEVERRRDADLKREAAEDAAATLMERSHLGAAWVETDRAIAGLLVEIDALLKKGDHTVALARVHEAEQLLAPYVSPEPFEIAALAAQAVADRKVLGVAMMSLWAAQEEIKLGAVLEGDATLEQVQQDLAGRSDPLAKQLAAKADRTRKSIVRKVAAAQKKEAEAQALADLCGRRPETEPWDGGLIEAESFMRRIAHDPGSVDAEDCTPAVLTDACWTTTCTIRGRNAFGAKTFERYTFAIMNGVVVAAE